jgi:hypothetical protein
VSLAPRSSADSAGKTARWHPLALVPLVLTAWVYYPITGVFFYFDDFYHLSCLTNEGSDLAWVLQPFGGHNYVVRNLVFLGSWQLFGLHSAPWYWTVFLTHLLNVWLLFGVLGALTDSVALACFGATLWGICPLALGTIGWYSVYGHVLATTILLVVLDRLARLAATGDRLPASTAWSWYALLLAGTTCFGTGIGVALVFPVVLFCLLPAAWRQPGVRLAYLALPAVTLALYFGVRALSGWIEPLPFSEVVHVQAARSGLWSAPAMLLPLLGFAVSGTALGHAFERARFLDAWTWVTIVAFVLGLGLIAWRGDSRARRTAVAMAALAVGIYGVIAVGRTQVYTMFHFPLAEAATEPRYHYFGSMPVVILICQVLQQVGRIGWLSAVPRGLLLAVGLALQVGTYARSSFRVDQHPATRDYLKRTIRELADAVAASPPGTTVYIENGETQPIIGPNLAMLVPGRAGMFLLLSPDDMLDGRHVRFVERDPDILAFWAARPGSRLATLLVAPSPAGE